MLALTGPVYIYWLLTRVSGVPPLEAHMKKTRPEAFAARHEAVAVLSLWTACVDACRHFDGTESRARAPGFHREALLACGDEDTNELVHATLIPLCGVFLDRGQSHWSMPDRERGFFSA